MMDFSNVIGFDWNTGNARKNNDKHDVSQGEAEEVFFNSPLVVSADDRHNRAESRYRALGITSVGRKLTIIFTLRQDGVLIRVISARDMHKKERRYYDQAN